MSHAPMVVTALDILGARILIVDDLAANVTLLARMLEGAGYTNVNSTMDPHEVCTLHRVHRYDLILLDLQMPGMDGFQVMDGLKDLESESYVPVLAITAQPAHVLRALQGGARDFVSKPFNLAEVLMRVRNLLEVRLLHDAARGYSRMLENLALQDPLTGLANRRLVKERMRLGLAHARMNKSSLAVMCLDLDGFKQVNDGLGHAAGDSLLKLVAGRLVAAVRDEDTVARLGGDEFMIVLWHVRGLSDVTFVAAKVVESVGQPYLVDGNSVSITISGGVSIFPTHGDATRTLMERADAASYEAKRGGRNTYRVASGLDAP